jgi:hypothetical protein
MAVWCQSFAASLSGRFCGRPLSARKRVRITVAQPLARAAAIPDFTRSQISSLSNSAILANIPLHFHFIKARTTIKAGTSVAFQDAPATDLSVSNVLQQILERIRDSIMHGFEPFFN